MTNLVAGAVRPLSLLEQETELAHASNAALAAFDVTGSPLMLRLENPQTSQQIEITVPAAAVRILRDALASLAQGRTVTLIPLHAELSTQQAADLMNVSRPYFIKLLEEGKIPYRKVGEQRRVRSQDLLDYIAEYQTSAYAALQEMTAEAQRLGLYE